MSKRLQTALNEMRLSLVDEMFRRGATPATIAAYLLADTKSVEHGLELGLTGRTDLSHPEKVRELTNIVRRDIGTLRSRLTLPCDPRQRQEALVEYVQREDTIFQEAWRDHNTAFSVKDKITALKLAQQAARNKAQALGVPLQPDPNDNPDLNDVGRLPAGAVVIHNLGQVAVLNGPVQRVLGGGGEGGNGHSTVQLSAPNN